MRIPPFRIERYFAPHEFTAPYLLSASDCEAISVSELLDLVPGAADEFGRQRLGYTETAGTGSLRAAIAGLYESIGADDVLVHSGASEAIFTFMNGLLHPGDQVIVHYPCYQSLFQIAETIGCEVVRWTVRPEDGWRLDPGFLESAITDRTRAVVMNTPHNPTGYLADRETQEAIVRIVRARNIVLLADEVYRGLEYDPGDRLPAACDLYDNAVSIGVMSKTYGLAGLRIGWMATHNREILRSALTLKDYTSLCNSAPGEYLAEVALRAGERLLERNRGIVLSNLPLLRGFFARHAERLRWVEPRAGTIGYPTLLSGGVDPFCAEVLDAVGVLLLPGTVYEDASRQIRFGFGRRNLPEALERLDRHLRQAESGGSAS